MKELIELEASRERIINRVCVPCASSSSGKRCDCCMDGFAIRDLDSRIDEAADKAADEHNPMPSF